MRRYDWRSDEGDKVTDPVGAASRLEHSADQLERMIRKKRSVEMSSQSATSAVAPHFNGYLERIGAQTPAVRVTSIATR